MAQLYVGTSGWAYPTWKPAFYPEKLAQKKFLSFYATKLNTVEVNFTFRQLVKETTVNKWIEETPAHFRFTIKAHQVLTHIKRLKGTDEFLRRFLTTLEALERAQKLGPVLFQLPPNFKADQAVLSDFLQTLPRSVRAAFEFRHASWFNEGTFDEEPSGKERLAKQPGKLCASEMSRSASQKAKSATLLTSSPPITPTTAIASPATLRPNAKRWSEGFSNTSPKAATSSPTSSTKKRRRCALCSRCIAELRSAERLSVSCSDAPVSLLLRFLPTADTHIVPSDTNARVLSGFLDYLRVERGSARLTIAAYTSDLGQFAEFLEKHHRLLSNARREDVRAFMQDLFSNQVDGRSVGRKLSAIRQLYRYLLLDGNIHKDPTLNIDSPKQWKVLPKALSRNEVDTMLTTPREGIRQLESAGAGLARSRHAGIALLWRLARLRSRRCATRRFEARSRIHPGPRQRRQGANGAAGCARAAGIEALLCKAAGNH